MAIIADCIQPDVDLPLQTYVLPNRLTNRFPTPPIAWGVIADDIENLWEVDGLDFPYAILGGPLHPEGQYVEPTIGQIWPRIG